MVAGDLHVFAPEHVPLAECMGRAFHEESPVTRRLPFNETKCRDWLMTYAVPAEDNSRRGWIVTRNNIVCGGLLAYAAEKPWCDGLVSGDAITYLAPSFRGSGVGSLLVDAYIAWAKSLDVKLIMLASSCNIDIDRAAGFYAKHGFRQIGTEALYEG